MSREIGSRLRVLMSLAALALAARKAGYAERAGRLWGGIEADEARAFHGGWASRRDEYESHVLVPGCPDLDRGLYARRRMALEEAVAYALAE